MTNKLTLEERAIELFRERHGPNAIPPVPLPDRGFPYSELRTVVPIGDAQERERPDEKDYEQALPKSDDERLVEAVAKLEKERDYWKEYAGFYNEWKICKHCGAERNPGTTPAKALCDEAGKELIDAHRVNALEVITRKTKEIIALKDEVERYSQMAFQYGVKCDGLCAEVERLKDDNEYLMSHQLDELRAENERLKDEVKLTRDRLIFVAADYREENERLREALVKIAGCEFSITITDIARAALQSKGSTDTTEGE